MGQGIRAEFGHRASGFLNHIVGGSLAFGHHGAGNVGDGEENVANLEFGSGEAVGHEFLRLFQCGHFLFGLFGLLFFALLHQRAYAGGKLAEAGGLVVVVELELTAAVVKFQYFFNRFLAVESFYGKTLYDESGILFNLL